MALSTSTLWLTNGIIEGVLPTLAALGAVQKASSEGKPEAADPSVLFAFSTLGFSAIPSLLFWRDGQLSGHRSYGIGTGVYHALAGAKLLYDRFTRPTTSESNALTVIGAVHLYMAFNFYKYVQG
ncbi:hypothetical protein DFJ74DRAFT_695139 [Hyaloraphidium curvatum]|nr:hypothetical protein DFJ74DRAFT_695139 [Hyaloraphidium curvatum]